MKNKYFIIIATAFCLLIFIYIIVKNNESAIVNNINGEKNDYSNKILLKRKGMSYVNNKNYDSLKYIIEKIEYSDTSLEVKIFKLYNYLVNNDTLEFNKLLKKSQDSNSENLFYLVNIGNILLNSDYYQDALQYYLKADSIYNFNNVDVMLNIAIIYSRLDENPKAISILTNAIKLDKEKPYLYYVRAASFYNIKKYYEAILDLNTAIDIERNNPDYYYLRGTIFKETGNMLAGQKDIDLAYKYGYSK